MTMSSSALVEFEKPGKEEVLQEVKKSGATSVMIIPFLLVAGDHVQNDILGSGPESWKSELLKHGELPNRGGAPRDWVISKGS